MAGNPDKVEPLHQFAISRLQELHIGGIDVSFTNSSLWMVACVAAASFFLTYSMSGRSLVPGRLQSLTELCYEFIANMVRDNAGKEGMKFFPLVFTLFVFVLTSNLLGMVPFSFTTTSHIIVTFALASLVISIVIVYGLLKNGLGFLRLFAPSGVPVIMLVLLTPIEIISFLSRPISLSVRLFANMLAGHTMLKVFAGFVYTFTGFVGAAKVFMLLPLLAAAALTGLEFLVAFLQAFIFSVLTCIYLNDAIHPGH